MDATFKQILKNGAASTIRAVLVFVGAWMVRKGVIAEAPSDAVLSQGVEFGLGLLMTLAGLVWSWWQKVHVNKKVDDALSASPNLSREEFEKKLDTGQISSAPKE